ncbi:MAG TPA: AMP-binding protein [Kofleriaceae bacterium]|nr:AMP-binding protein [Kofleriaceae bacterium]
MTLLIIDRLVLAPVELALATPHRAAHGVTSVRHGLRIELHAGPHRGLGEAWPLPGYSPDTLAQCRAELEAVTVPALDLDRPLLPQIAAAVRPIAAPAARFALETALLALAGQRGRSCLFVFLAPERQKDKNVPVPLAVLVGSVGQAGRAVARGIGTVKIKVGGGDWPAERALVAAVRAAHPGLAIRVDANRALEPGAAPAQLAALAALGVELIEEPVAPAHLAALLPSPVPIALDESLAELPPREIEALLASGAVQALVLKPTLLGGALPCLELAELAARHGAQVIVTHCLEGEVARAATCELALAIGTPAPCGLDADPRELDVPQLRERDVWPAAASGLGPGERPALSVLRAAAEAPDRIALIHSEDELTYRELAARVRVEMRALRQVGATERLALVARRDPTTVTRILAALELGARVGLLHPRATAEELRAQRQRLARVSGAGIVVFTSGSTGTPRGVILDRDALAASATASAANLGWRDEDRWLVCLPLAHVGGLAILMRTLLARRCAVLEPEGPFDPARLIATIESRRATLVSLVPAMLARLLDEHPAWAPPSQLRAVLLGGAASHPALLARARARGLPVLPTYGMSEAGSQLCTPRPGEPPVGCGPPLPGVELALEDDGRIRVRGPMLMRGYLEDPSGLDAEGWFRTNDRGAIDAAGNLHVLGRTDDVIVTGGENVDPREVEDALLALPGVRAACVVGVPDPVFGEVVGAAVVLDGADADRVRAALGDTLARYKHPRAFVALEALPLGPTGKIDRAACRACFAAP